MNRRQKSLPAEATATGGSLRFKVNLSDYALSKIGLPVEVRLPDDMALVSRTLTTNTVTELDPGPYLVEVTLPAGQVLRTTVTVEKGMTTIAELTPHLKDQSPLETEAQTHFLSRPAALSAERVDAASSSAASLTPSPLESFYVSPDLQEANDLPGSFSYPSDNFLITSGEDGGNESVQNVRSLNTSFGEFLRENAAAETTGEILLAPVTDPPPVFIETLSLSDQAPLLPIFNTAAPRLSLASSEVQKAASDGAVSAWEARLRFWRGNAYRGSAVRVPVAEAIAGRKDLTSGAIRLLLKTTEEPLYLQIVRPEIPSCIVALPTWSGAAGSVILQWETPAKTADVVNADQGGGAAIPSIAVAIHVPDLATDVMLNYRAAADLTLAHAALQGVDADALLPARKKSGDAISAVTAGYAYLRFAKLDDAQRVADRLYARFPNFPDGLALSAEYGGRTGNCTAALKQLLQLRECGVPLFSQGLSFAAARLDDWLRDAGDFWNDFTPEQRGEAAAIRDRLRCFTAAADFRRHPLTFFGKDPNTPDNAAVPEALSPLDETQEIRLLLPIFSSKPTAPTLETLSIASDATTAASPARAIEEEKETIMPTEAAPAPEPSAAKSAELLARIAATEARWNDRAAQRGATQEKIENFKKGEGLLQNVEDDPTLKALRRQRLSENPLVMQTGAAPAAPGLEELSIVENDAFFERVIGGNNLLKSAFLDLGSRTLRTVGRVRIGSPMVALTGYGTGFLVAPRVLLTNNHVLPDTQTAANSLIEFDYSLDADFRERTSRLFRLMPGDFFVTDGGLDYTLVAVSEIAEDGTPLTGFGYNRLFAQQGKINKGEAVNIIQHPGGQIKQIALQENRLIDRLDDFLIYEADTTAGSSGSPLYNNQWEIVGLHHSGKPKTNADGKYLARSGAVWTSDMGEDQIWWEGNEGIRISRILDHANTKAAGLADSGKALLASLIAAPALAGGGNEMAEASPVVTPPANVAVEDAPQGIETPVTPLYSAPDPTPAVIPAASGVTPLTQFTIPLVISISVGAVSVGGAVAPAPVTASTPLSEDLLLPGELEKITIDPNYADRRGYLPDFLGVAVPLPQLSAAQGADAAKNRRAIAGDDPALLRYHHFSVMVSRSRRLAFYTAVNIDGTLAQSPKREKDFWILDPRILPIEQVPGGFYEGNDFDRGHLVRRLDPAWGTDDFVVKTANDDTFHFSNCSPQHKDFNQGKTLWAGLEDFLLNGAKAKDQKISVFTGPLFATDDPVYRGVRVPLAFWKVVAFAKPGGGGVSSAAFLVSQKKLVQNMALEAAFVPATFQVPIARIAALTGLSFGDLPKSDPLNAQNVPGRESLELRESVGVDSPAREIGVWNDITLA